MFLKTKINAFLTKNAKLNLYYLNQKYMKLVFTSLYRIERKKNA